MIPEDCKFTREHEWVKVEGDSATIGITHYASGRLGDIVFVELPEKGRILEQFKTFGVVESVKATSDLYAPLSGEVVEINSGLEEHPEFVNLEPYGKGWMLKIKIRDLKELDALMSPEDYRKLLSVQP